MSVPDSVKRLIETFEDNIDFYKSNQYNEAQLRQEFLDPFFKELGWDMDNEAGLAPQYRDVIHEASIKIGGSTRAPDYAFSIHGQYKFFLEAKKPLVNVRDDIEPAYQLRRYGWSAKLPISILTDFEEFSIYDCRKRPKRGERASISRLAYFKYNDYIEKWDELKSTFSKEAILKGSFDKYAIDTKRHRGTETVDYAFLSEIENWRNLLAKNFALRNPSLSVRDLNYAVQKVIDRLIFLRICEDRGIEEYKQLDSLIKEKNIYPRLLNLFLQADDKYNSGLFHFSEEKGRGVPDTISPILKLDDNVFKEIIGKLYYPDSPYEFSVLPADILGQVYEQFLGKTIQLTSGHQAKIEEKPEVRKAGGVYYTPSFIVDYIIKNTLGRLLDGDDFENPKPVAVAKAAKIKVLDPACGSGSFLIVAYQHLLDWHLRQYTVNLDKDVIDEGKIRRHAGGKNPKIYQTPSGEWKLTTDERKRILLNNIHGVDIDAQAVEVTKLSLLLKVIEGETLEIRQRDWIKERQRILPDLGKNIICGNSLIATDLYDNEQMLMLDEETQYRINVFDWQHGFPEVIPKGGFNCVIGNPPYVRQESIKASKEYFSIHYEAASGTADLYVYFLEKAVRLLCDGGCASFIVSSSFLKTNFGKNLRKTLKAHSAVTAITDFGGLPVFQSAKDTYVCIPLLQKIQQPKRVNIRKIKSLDPTKRETQLNAPGYTIPESRLSPSEWATRSDEEDALFQRLIKSYPAFSSLNYGFNRGITTGLNKAFIISSKIRKKIIEEEPSSDEVIYPMRGGKDCRRYKINATDDWIIFTRRGINIEKYPAIKKHLLQYKEDLTPKTSSNDKKGRKPGRYKWYEIQDDVVYWQIFSRPKIIFPDICKNPRFSIDHSGIFLANTAYAIGSDDRYLIGILNSKLFWFLIGHISIPFGVRAGKFRYRLIYQYMEKVPIRKIDINNADDVIKHDSLVGLVERMSELHKKKAGEDNPDTSRLIETQNRATDRQIDRLVYDLYDLTPEEINIVEQNQSL